MEENFDKLIVGKIDDFLDILQEITIRVNEDSIKYPEKYKNLTRYEIYENCRDLSIKYYDITKNKKVLDFDDSIEEFLKKELSEEEYTHTVAVMKVGNNYILYQLDSVIDSASYIVTKYKAQFKVKDDVECTGYTITNVSKLKQDTANLEKELNKLKSLRRLVLYRNKFTGKYLYTMIVADISDINFNDKDQLKHRLIISGDSKLNDGYDLLAVDQYSDERECVIKNMVDQLNHMISL